MFIFFCRKVKTVYVLSSISNVIHYSKRVIMDCLFRVDNKIIMNSHPFHISTYDKLKKDDFSVFVFFFFFSLKLNMSFTFSFSSLFFSKQSWCSIDHRFNFDFHCNHCSCWSFNISFVRSKKVRKTKFPCCQSAIFMFLIRSMMMDYI